MGQSTAYGNAFGEVFGLEEAPAIVTKILKKSEIAVTEVRSDFPRLGVTSAIPKEDAFLVGLQLRDFPNHQMWEDERSTVPCDLRAGEITLYDLKRSPLVLIDKPFHSIHFYIPRAALNLIADAASAPRIGDLQYIPGKGIADATIMSLGQSMLAAFTTPHHASRLFVDHVTLAVATHVAQTYGHLKPIALQIRGGLAPWQIRRAKDIMNANLDGSVSLQAIADECGLSASHFARAFRASTGVAPHAWLLRHRVHRAKALLPDLTRSLSDVALACGFADQSHFTRVFTRDVGSSPGKWRRCLKD